MNLSPQQSSAVDAVGRWLRARDRPFFYMAGFAGTGKTTLARHLAAQSPGATIFASLTGKAAKVMRERGCEGARTLHSLLYRPVERDVRRLEALERDLCGWMARPPTDLNGVEEQIVRLRAEIAAERKRLRAPGWALNPDSDLRGASLLVVDECSMVDARVAADVLSFEVPVLALGDPFQLPPVFGDGFFTRGRPDHALTEVQRQALDSPILRAATDVREGRGLRGPYGPGVEIVPVASFDPDATGTAQILVGRNRTRRRANARVRRNRGLPEGVPAAGDRVVCLRNDHEAGLLNGGIWDVRDAAPADGRVSMVLRDGGLELVVEAHAALFSGGEVPYWEAREAQAFDFAYALTVHKAQGSEFDDVLLVDESRCFGPEAPRWLYTGITRARETLTVVTG